MQTPTLIVTLLLALLFVVTLAKGIRTVSQGEEWVVERFGKFLRTLKPGLSVIIPFMDSVSYKVIMKDIVLDIPRQEVITRDNAVINTNAIAFIRVLDPPTAVYGVVNFEKAIGNLVQTSLRSIIGELDLDEALSSREKIKSRLRNMLAEDVSSWGLNLKSVEIQDIQPSDTMQVSMEQQAAAERERKAMITRAEGAKQSAILEAEGRLESAKRDAEAEVTLADASRRAIQLIQETAPDPQLALQYLLGQKYVESLKEMGTSNNSKILLVPADLHESIRGILRRVTDAPTPPPLQPPSTATSTASSPPAAPSQT